MIRARTLLIASIACAVAAGPAGAGIERAGTTAANFLALGSGPGVLAMGGAGLALEGGLAAFDWNPATLARIGRTEAGFSHAALGEQNAQEWAGVGSRLRFGGLSGAVTGLFQHEGSFEGRDALNNPTGSFDVSSVALGVGVARAIGPLVTAGLGIKYAGENLGGVRGSGVAFDAGVQVRSAGFGFGAAAQNAFGRMKYDAASYEFPASYGFGVSYEHATSGLRVALDMNFPAAYYNDIRGGLEWRWNERFALRTGYRAELGAASSEPMGGPTFGMGAGAGSMWFDYGYLVGGAGVGQHRIAITFRPGSTASPPGGLEHASTNALPATDKPQSAPEKPRPRTPEGAPPTASAVAPSRPPASAPSSVPLTSSPSAAPARTPATATPPVSAAARPVATPTPPAGASARPVPAATPPASAAASSSPRAAAPASAGAAAAGPLAAQTGSAPPSYTQRAKAARGTGEASANDRKTAALAPPATGAPRPPVAPQATSPPPAKRDSTAMPKSSPAPATNAPAASPTPAPAARPDSAAAPSPAPVPGKRPEKVRVKNGQTMNDIARAYGTSVPAIMMENNLVTDRVHPGQTLKLPRR